MKILDTDHCIAILRKQLDLREHVSGDEELGTTAISVAELMHGAQRSQHRDDNLARLEVLLSAMIVLPLEAKGGPLDNLDLQIASIAIENDLPLLTNNTRHFKRVSGLHLLNWLK